MKRLSRTTLAVLAALSLAGACTKGHKAEPTTAPTTTTGNGSGSGTTATVPDGDLNKRVARLERKMAKIENVLKQAGVPLDAPPEPGPDDVFNVPQNPADPSVGPPYAKVTLVEAFDFA